MKKESKAKPFKPLKCELVQVIEDYLSERNQRLTNLNKVNINKLHDLIIKFNIMNYEEIILNNRMQKQEQKEKEEKEKKEREAIAEKQKQEQQAKLNEIYEVLTKKDLEFIKDFYFKEEQQKDKDYIKNNSEKIQKAKDNKKNLMNGLYKEIEQDLGDAPTIEELEDGEQFLNLKGVKIHFTDFNDYKERNNERLERDYNNEKEEYIIEYYEKYYNEEKKELLKPLKEYF
jgi:hypothetical protein